MINEYILVEKNENLAVVTINRRERRNAITPEMLKYLRNVAEDLRGDTDTRVVIFRGSGNDFSVGVDIAGMNGKRPPVVAARRMAEEGALLVRAIREISQPTICVIQGIASGGATCIATACDFRIGTTDSRVGYGEVKLGINLMWRALPLAIQAVGLARAKQMVMTGDMYDANRLAEWGFFDEIVSEDCRDIAAVAMARKFAALPPIAVQMIKGSANAYAGALDNAVMHADTDQWLVATRTFDHNEAIDAFFDKRQGQFIGD